MSNEPIGISMAVEPFHLDPHAREMLRVARERGHDCYMTWLLNTPKTRSYRLGMRIGGSVFSFRYGSMRRQNPAFPLSKGDHINTAAFPTVVSKQRTKDFLAARGFPVPEGRVFDSADIEAACDYAEALGWPVCVKPDLGKKGYFVAPGLVDRDAVRTAFAAAGSFHPNVVVERSLVGEVIRFFYVEPRVVGVKISMPPNVVGDGIADIATLIARKNAEREVRKLPGHKPIVVNSDLTDHLKLSGLDLHAVPSGGERVLLRSVSNGAVGADTIECADTIHPSYAAMVEQMCHSLAPMKIAALDTIVTDRTLPASAETFAVLEINNSPGVLPYLYPWEGRKQDICVPIIEMLERVAAERA
jgi:cyanophycin synthetase